MHPRLVPRREIPEFGAPSDRDLLAASSGLLAEGPVGILSEYEAVLARHSIAWSQVRERAPKRWNGGSWVAESEGLKVLTMGPSFVVAESFTATRPDAVV